MRKQVPADKTLEHNAETEPVGSRFVTTHDSKAALIFVGRIRRVTPAL